jgi:hypothetical protein
MAIEIYRQVPNPDLYGLLLKHLAHARYLTPLKRAIKISISQLQAQNRAVLYPANLEVVWSYTKR